MVKDKTINEEKRPCPFCGGRNFRPLFQAKDFDRGKVTFTLVTCIQCSLVRTEPVCDVRKMQNLYSLPYYGSGETKFSGIGEKLISVLASLRARFLLRLIHSNRKLDSYDAKRILDIGCGRGNLLKRLKQKGMECYGVEREEFPLDEIAKGIHFFKKPLREIEFPPDFFDTVIFWHVLEHLDEPHLDLQEVVRILKPYGKVAIAVPNFGSIQVRWFRKNWFHLDLPRHRYHYTFESLSYFLNRIGLTVIRKGTFSLEQNLYGFIQSILNIIFPNKYNRLYSLLKRQDGKTNWRELMAWAGMGVILLPFALLEYGL